MFPQRIYRTSNTSECVQIDESFFFSIYHRVVGLSTMPQPILPTEIVDNIIEKLAEGPKRSCIQALLSCSVASRSFRGPCQQRIFRDVTLASPPISRISQSNLVVHPQTYSIFRRTRLFVDVVTRNACLSAHVEHLTYELTSVTHYSSERDCRDRDYVLSSFPLLPNVKAFTLGVHNPEEDLSLAISLSDEPTERAMLAMIRRPQVQSLALSFISDLDITFLHEVMGAARTLSLRRCALAGVWSDDDDDVDRYVQPYWHAA